MDEDAAVGTAGRRDGEEARRERKTGVERKNERERPVMAAMMTVSGCVYRLSRSVQARRPSAKPQPFDFDPLFYSSITRVRSNFLSLLHAYYSLICCQVVTHARVSFFPKLEFLNRRPTFSLLEEPIMKLLFTY